MSWIKKIFTIFQNEDEEINHIDRDLNQEKPLRQEPTGTRDVEAKVLYQYPKGQFRFPLIPDNEKTAGAKREKGSRSSSMKAVTEVKPLIKEQGPLRFKENFESANEASQSVPHESGNEASPKLRRERGKAVPSGFRTESLKESSVKEANESAEETVQKFRYQPGDEVAEKIRQGKGLETSPKFRQPFKPTEIPSPIYAYNRPPIMPKKTSETEQIEYELTGFEREQIEKEKRSNSAGHHFTQEHEALEKSEKGLKEHAESTQQAVEASHDVAESTQQAVEASHDAAESTQQACEQELITLEHPAIISLPEESGDESVPEYESGQGGADERPTEPRKRVLPFNVIMLKQDKKKWEERKVLDSLQIRSNRTADYQSSDAMSGGNVPSAQGEIVAAENGASAQGEIVAAENIPSAQGEIVAAENVPSAQGEIQAAGDYAFPPLDLLNPPVFKAPDPQWLAEQEHMLNETLKNFNVGARVVNMTQGPSVTRFEVQPEPGVKVNKITNLSDDIKLSLAAKDIRIEAPIPGKHTIGIEVPNQSSRPVLLSEILQSGNFLDQESPLSVALGLDIAGNPIVTDLKKMPHGLIAGATGSGKSVCINTMLVSLLYKAHPDDVKLLLIDPKMVELAPYNQIPHLVSPVITDVKAATASLKWAVEEMERRYELFAHTGVRDISRFNELAIKYRRFSDKLPYIVIVIDELADLMMMAPTDVEEAICRIAQKARACGIHLIVATQRPSVDVITGLIKANVPTRIAFSVSSQIDSRTIIDMSGAEKLLGRGDMLFLENGSSKPFRLQGTFVTDSEIDDIVAFVREQRAPEYLFEQEELLRKAQISEDEDELFYEACEFVVEQGGASTSSVQRRFKIGYNRAARLIEMMEQQGFISEGRGSKPRDVLISAADLESIQD